MPKVTIWVREGEDLAIWKQVYNPEWLHNVIQASQASKEGE